MIHIEHHPGRGQLLLFGLLWLLFFCFWGTASWWKSGLSVRAAIFWAVAFVVPAVGLIWQEFLRRVYLLALYASLPIGIIVSFVALIFIYYLVVTPIGFALRWAGHDAMQRDFDRVAESYWVPRKPESNPERYFKQF